MLTRVSIVLAALLLCAACACVQGDQMPAEYRQVLSYLGRSGDYKGNVLKVNIPRNDLNVTVHGFKTPTPFGFGGWVAMTKGDGGKNVLMGDLVLTEDEVNPVISSLLANGLEVTALHNHFFWENPRVFFMHVHGMGTPAELSRRLKAPLALIGGPRGAAPSPAPSAAAPTGLDTAAIAKIVGHDGEQTGAVYKITVGREDIDLKEHGATINARMGLNTWAAFVGTDQDAAVAGDVAMLENEVNPVLRALRKNGIDVVAIHHHMIGTQPMVIFLHYWGRGNAQKLAAGFKAALDQLGKAPGETH